jgi:signal transduction histidine kinase
VRVDGGTARLEVTDDGAGFDPRNGDAAAADGHIGLPLLRDLATDAGGTLSVDSAEGRGTTVRMEVPIG